MERMENLFFRFINVTVLQDLMEGGGMKFVANDTARATFTFSTILRISSAVN